MLTFFYETGGLYCALLKTLTTANVPLIQVPPYYANHCVHNQPGQQGERLHGQPPSCCYNLQAGVC